MKLSESTMAILKNFAMVNVNLVIQPGKTINTIGASRNIFAKAEVADEFPNQVCLYDLNSFIQAISLFDDVDLDFQDKLVNIQNGTPSAKNGSAKIKYFYSDPSVVTAAPNKNITLDEKLFSCNVAAGDIASILKAAAALAAPTIAITSNDGVTKIVVNDRKNSSSHSYSVTLPSSGETKKGKKEATVVPEFDAVLRAENFKLLPGNYACTVGKKIHKDNSSVGIIEWINQDVPLTYWMTTEAESKI